MPAGTSRCRRPPRDRPGAVVSLPHHRAGLRQRVAEAQGWFVLNWRRDTTIDSAALAPKVDESVFRERSCRRGPRSRCSTRPAIRRRDPAGGSGSPLAHDGRLSEAAIPGTGPPSGAASATKAFDALIGRPAPEFPAGSDLARRPAPDLAGAPRPGRGPRLLGRVERRLSRGPRPARSAASGPRRRTASRSSASTRRAASRTRSGRCRGLHLEFPICVDVPPAEGTDAWGELFGRFAVQRSRTRWPSTPGEGHRVRPARGRPGSGRSDGQERPMRAAAGPPSNGVSRFRAVPRTAALRLVSTRWRR